MISIRAFYLNLVICSYRRGATERVAARQNAPHYLAQERLKSECFSRLAYHIRKPVIGDLAI
jgi:hypothetical protein